MLATPINRGHTHTCVVELLTAWDTMQVRVRMREHTDLLYVMDVASIGLAIGRIALNKRFSAGTLCKFRSIDQL